jgi:hypothetical protein
VPAIAAIVEAGRRDHPQGSGDRRALRGEPAPSPGRRSPLHRRLGRRHPAQQARQLHARGRALRKAGPTPKRGLTCDAGRSRCRMGKWFSSSGHDRIAAERPGPGRIQGSRWLLNLAEPAMECEGEVILRADAVNGRGGARGGSWRRELRRPAVSAASGSTHRGGVPFRGIRGLCAVKPAGRAGMRRVRRSVAGLSSCLGCR